MLRGNTSTIVITIIPHRFPRGPHDGPHVHMCPRRMNRLHSRGNSAGCNMEHNFGVDSPVNYVAALNDELVTRKIRQSLYWRAT